MHDIIMHAQFSILYVFLDEIMDVRGDFCILHRFFTSYLPCYMLCIMIGLLSNSVVRHRRFISRGNRSWSENKSQHLWEHTRANNERSVCASQCYIYIYQDSDVISYTRGEVFTQLSILFLTCSEVYARFSYHFCLFSVFHILKYHTSVFFALLNLARVPGAAGRRSADSDLGLSYGALGGRIPEMKPRSLI